MTGTGMSPCAACKLLRRRCTGDCVFAPYFPPDEPQKFANVHKVFGAANVNKMLQELPMEARGDAVSSMVYEANARVRDPVYGCVGAISSLQQQVAHLQKQLAVANAEIVCMQINNDSSSDCNLGYDQNDAPEPSSHHHGYNHHHYGNHMSPPMQPQSPEVHSNPYRGSNHYNHNSESYGEHMMWT